MIVYLAGSLKPTPLRSKLVALLNRQHEVIDPIECPHSDEAGYTAWETAAIRRCDFLVAFMEDGNPSGYGLSFEVGFAHALGKRIVFYDRLTDERRRFFGMVRSVSEIA